MSSKDSSSIDALGQHFESLNTSKSSLPIMASGTKLRAPTRIVAKIHFVKTSSPEQSQPPPPRSPKSAYITLRFIPRKDSKSQSTQANAVQETKSMQQDLIVDTDKKTRSQLIPAVVLHENTQSLSTQAQAAEQKTESTQQGLDVNTDKKTQSQHTQAGVGKKDTKSLFTQNIMVAKETEYQFPKANVVEKKTKSQFTEATVNQKKNQPLFTQALVEEKDTKSIQQDPIVDADKNNLPQSTQAIVVQKKTRFDSTKARAEEKKSEYTQPTLIADTDKKTQSQCNQAVVVLKNTESASTQAQTEEKKSERMQQGLDVNTDKRAQLQSTEVGVVEETQSRSTQALGKNTQPLFTQARVVEKKTEFTQQCLGVRTGKEIQSQSTQASVAEKKLDSTHQNPEASTENNAESTSFTKLVSCVKRAEGGKGKRVSFSGELSESAASSNTNSSNLSFVPYQYDPNAPRSSNDCSIQHDSSPGAASHASSISDFSYIPYVYVPECSCKKRHTCKKRETQSDPSPKLPSRVSSGKHSLAESEAEADCSSNTSPHHGGCSPEQSSNASSRKPSATKAHAQSDCSSNAHSVLRDSQQSRVSSYSKPNAVESQAKADCSSNAYSINCDSFSAQSGCVSQSKPDATQAHAQAYRSPNAHSVHRDSSQQSRHASYSKLNAVESQAKADCSSNAYSINCDSFSPQSGCVSQSKPSATQAYRSPNAHSVHRDSSQQSSRASYSKPIATKAHAHSDCSNDAHCIHRGSSSPQPSRASSGKPPVTNPDIEDLSDASSADNDSSSERSNGISNFSDLNFIPYEQVPKAEGPKATGPIQSESSSGPSSRTNSTSCRKASAAEEKINAALKSIREVDDEKVLETIQTEIGYNDPLGLGIAFMGAKAMQEHLSTTHKEMWALKLKHQCQQMEIERQQRQNSELAHLLRQYAQKLPLAENKALRAENEELKAYVAKLQSEGTEMAGLNEALERERDDTRAENKRLQAAANATRCKIAEVEAQNRALRAAEAKPKDDRTLRELAVKMAQLGEKVDSLESKTKVGQSSQPRERFLATKRRVVSAPTTTMLDHRCDGSGQYPWLDSHALARVRARRARLGLDGADEGVAPLVGRHRIVSAPVSVLERVRAHRALRERCGLNL